MCRGHHTNADRERPTGSTADTLARRAVSGKIAAMKFRMTTPWLILAGVALLGAGPAGSAERARDQAVPAFARQVPEIKSGEPVFAFSGKDLDGWYTFLRDHQHEDPDNVFSIQGGMLVISGQGFGGITTRQSFRDYHLVTEWKWGERTWNVIDPVRPSLNRRTDSARDAGILVHGVGEDGAAYGNWLESIEVQIIEGGVGDFLVVGGKEKPSLTCAARADGRQYYFDPGSAPVTLRAGRFNWWGRDPNWTDTLAYRGPREVERPHGEWNRLEVVCDGDRITTILNGLVVNVGTDSSHTEGKIQLQSEGAEIIFRKVEVRPLIK